MIKKITLLIALYFSFAQFSDAQTYLTEGFEGPTFPPPGWTSFIGTNGIGTVEDWFQATAPYSGSFSAASVYENVTGGIAEDWLVTSQIDLTGATNVQLNFFSAQSFGPDYGSTFEIRVSTASQTNHADFSTVATFDESNIGGSGLAFELKSVDLSAYAGMMIYVAFVHLNDDGDNWIIDDIEVKSPLALDAELQGVSLNRYALTSTNNQISVDVKNDGATPITALDISWTDGTNTYPETLNVNIAPGLSQTINLQTQVNYGTVEEKDITVTINNVNGVADGEPGNNSLMRKFNTMSQAGTKAVVIEESTGTWCGFCPRGTIGLDYMSSTYPNSVVAIAVHNDDPMEVPAYDAALVSVIGAGWPNSGLDRKLVDVDPGQASLQAAYNTQIMEVVPLDLNSSATIVGNNVTITAQATFYTRFSSADFRIGVIITEDNVTGTSSGYNQVNYYAGNALGPMGGYENLPDPVPASQMVYNHVGRAILGGFDGAPGSVPAVINDGDTVNFNFNYTIPGNTLQEDLNVVVVLIDQTDGTIVNGFERTLMETLSVQDFSIDGFKIFPNPVEDVLNISFESGEGDYTVQIVDILGRTVANQTLSNVLGNQNVSISTSNLSTGQYILTISNEKGAYNTKFIKN